MMFIYPFLMLCNNPYDYYYYYGHMCGFPTIWAFFRNLFAVIFLSWPIVWVEVLLKQRQGTVFDVLFKIGIIGTILSAVETLGYLIANLIASDNTPVFAQYFGAMFSNAGTFFEALACLIGTGVFILLVLIAIKYSSSLRIYAYLKFIVTLGFVIKTAIDGGYFTPIGYFVYAVGYYYGLFAPMLFGYILFFVDFKCGEQSLISS